MENKYEAVVEYINTQIDNGRLKPGNRLPSIREICERFACSKSTAIRAYVELEKRHVIYSIPKSGYYILDNRNTETVKKMSEDINFRTIAPDMEVLPYPEFQHCIDQAIDIYKESLFGYSNPRGIHSLRSVIAKQLQDYQVFTYPDNIFVVSGSQQAINYLSHMPFPNGKVNVLVDQPTYPGIINALRINNITAIGIERTAAGIDFSELERLFCNGNIKFYFTMARFHNPTGHSFTIEERKRIVYLAQKYDVYIVEDDFLADLETDSKSDPLFSYDTNSRVIYVKSYSKVLLPGLRLGVVVLPKLLVNSFIDYKRWDDICTSVLSQGALEIYIKSGMFANHAKKITPYYRQKMKVMNDIIQDYTAEDITSSIPGTGVFVLLDIKGSISADSLIHNLQSRNIYVPDIRKCYLPSFKKENLLRLSTCLVDYDKMHKGVPVVFEEIRKLLNQADQTAASFDDI